MPLFWSRIYFSHHLPLHWNPLQPRKSCLAPLHIHSSTPPLRLHLTIQHYYGTMASQIASLYNRIMSVCADPALTIDLRLILSQLSFMVVVATLAFCLGADHLKCALSRLCSRTSNVISLPSVDIYNIASEPTQLSTLHALKSLTSEQTRTMKTDCLLFCLFVRLWCYRKKTT